jgi:protein transport protein SEC31
LYTLQPIADIPNEEPEQQVSETQNSPSDLFSAGGLSSSQQKRYDVQWSPLKRGVVSTCSFDRKVQAHSVIGLATVRELCM